MKIQLIFLFTMYIVSTNAPCDSSVESEQFSKQLWIWILHNKYNVHTKIAADPETIKILQKTLLDFFSKEVIQ